MLYILTAEEINALVPRAELLKMAERADKAEIMCEAYRDATALIPETECGGFLSEFDRIFRHNMEVYEGRKTNFS